MNYKRQKLSVFSWLYQMNIFKFHCSTQFCVSLAYTLLVLTLLQKEFEHIFISTKRVFHNKALKNVKMIHVLYLILLIISFPFLYHNSYHHFYNSKTISFAFTWIQKLANFPLYLALTSSLMLPFDQKYIFFDEIN